MRSGPTGIVAPSGSLNCNFPANAWHAWSQSGHNYVSTLQMHNTQPDAWTPSNSDVWKRTSARIAWEKPSRNHWLGTDNTGRDVFARLCYAFNISISFSLILTILNYLIGVSIGGAMGYFGGKFDLPLEKAPLPWSITCSTRTCCNRRIHVISS